MRLFMMLLGCKPPGRMTEQHDVVFGIASTPAELIPQIKKAWPDAGKIHLDALREVTAVDGYQVQVTQKKDERPGLKLFFLNLGGYRKNEFDEFHYKMLTVAEDKSEAIKKAKQSAFYKHTGFPGASSHIDDKYGVDVDDIYEINDALPENIKGQYSIIIQASTELNADHIQLGYITLDKLALMTS